jgi:hypothetical protein
MTKMIECPTLMQSTTHIYEVRPRKDHRGVNLICDALPFGCGTTDQMLSAMQSDTRSTTAGHMML